MNKNYIKLINECYKTISDTIIKTSLQYSKRLSDKYGHNIYLKREDLQKTRSFKLRGALHKIKKIYEIDKPINIVCASAGNHAQGVAYTCNLLGIKGDIFVPIKTPLQKIDRINFYGKDNINIHLYGDNVNKSLDKAIEFSNNNKGTLIHPYDDIDIINGQATIGYEIYESISPDLIVCPIGGGGLISGISSYSKAINPKCKIIGVEPENANSMMKAFDNNSPIQLDNIDIFVDGASVSLVGKIPFKICKNTIDKIYIVENTKLCYNLVEFYQEDGIILEPAGGLSPSCIDTIIEEYNYIKPGIKLNIVCILSGGNNDLTRYNEIMDMSLKYKKLIHYLVVDFSQRPGELKLFINNILGPTDDIIRFEYIKKSNINYGKVLIGLQVLNKNDIIKIEGRLVKNCFIYEKINSNILL